MTTILNQTECGGTTVPYSTLVKWEIKELGILNHLIMP